MNSKVHNLPSGVITPPLEARVQDELERLGYGNVPTRVYIPPKHSSKPRKTPVLTKAQKQQAIDLVLRDKLPARVVAVKFGKSRTYIHRLVREALAEEKHHERIDSPPI